MTHNNPRLRRLAIAAAASLIATVVAVGVARPAFAVPQLVTVTATFPPPNPEFNFGFVECPAGTSILGGGAAIVADAATKDHVHVDGFVPGSNSNPSHIEGGGQDHDLNFSGVWSLRVMAICGVVSGWEFVEAVKDMPPGQLSTSVNVACPANKKVIGAGGADGKGYQFKLIGVDPSNDLTSVTVKSITTEPANFTNEVKAFAICVNPVRGQQLVTANSPTNTSGKTVTVACPAGTKVHGLGGGVTGAGGLAHITRLEKLTATTATLEASGGPVAPVQGWAAHVHAICAP